MKNSTIPFKKMKKLSLITIIFLLFILSQPKLSLSKKCNPQDKQILLKIKKAFNNAYHFASWDPDTDCCVDWYMVMCHRETNRIISLEIFEASISGTIPDVVGGLVSLEILSFHKITNLTGRIPPTLARLTNLDMLVISQTDVSGPILPSLSQLKNLTYLDLTANNLSGPIPPFLSSLSKLNELRLDKNRLTGSIPSMLPVSMQSLHLSHNQLSGTIPKAWEDAKFRSLEMQGNMIEGDASLLFSRNKSLEYVDLSNNVLHFDISKVEFPEGLKSLDLNHNRISGALPEGLAAVESLTSLNVSYNRLCGRIPAGGVMQEMDSSAYFNNKCLCGAPLPDCK